MKPSNLLIRTAAAVTAALRKRPFLQMVSTRAGNKDLGMGAFQGKFNAMQGTVAAPAGMSGDRSGVYGMRAIVANAGTVGDVTPGTALGSTKPGYDEYIWSFIWNYIDSVYDDNEGHQYWDSSLMDQRSFQAHVQAICDNIEREAFRAWLGGAAVFQEVGTNGFADSDSTFDTEWRTGLQVKLADNGAIGDLYALLNPTDHGQLKGVDGVAAADARGDMGAAARMDVQMFDGVYWVLANNIPKSADSKSGTVTTNGAITANNTDSVTWDGGGSIKAGAIVTFGSATNRYLVTEATGTTFKVHKQIAQAVANNTTVNAINDQVSLVASKMCLGHAPALIVPDASDPDYVVLQDMGTMAQPGTGLGCAIERNRATIARSNYIFTAALAAGVLNGKGVGVLVPA